MKPVIGIICEYDPFHRGHQRQFELARELLPGARIVCVMSGCFTQRGMPALHAPRERAARALDAGADMVLELPCAFAVRDAERFALGGVGLLSRLGFVTHLCFGAESGLDTLLPAAELLEAPTPAFEAATREGLKRGMSVAAAQGAALAACLPEANAAAWEKPNNILALCYLRAIWRLHSPLTPLPVRREGDYHGQTLGVAYPSATAVRAAFLRGEHAQADAACGYILPREPVCRPDALDRLLLHRLRMASMDELRHLPDCAEGLENRLKRCAMEARSREELLALLKTKRYAYARLSRLCCHALLGVTRELLDAHPLPEYARLLGLKRGADDLRGLMRESGLPVLSRAGDGMPENDSLLALDCRAYELWALGAGLAGGMFFTQGVVVK